LSGNLIPYDTLDADIDYTRSWIEKTGIALKHFISLLSVAKRKFHAWIESYVIL